MTRLAPLLLLPLLLSPVSALAQNESPDRWQIALEDGSYRWDIRLLRLEGDSIVFRGGDTLGRVAVEHIAEIRLIRKSEMRIGTGAPAGGAINALTGADDEVYDLTPMDYPARLRAVQQLFLLHPPAEPSHQKP